ncbi:type II toxin-antitoxin system Phd/YefM family antitoxin [Azotobacter beijerinckii]|nr:type II toxin-antitoxin system prevent-host-death family antitoxin [Azotobacter beijerinckii]
MMEIIPLADAKNNLSRLVDAASDGQEIIIAKHGRPMARLVAAGKPVRLRYGTLKGQIHVADDFDAELPSEALAGFEGKGSA